MERLGLIINKDIIELAHSMIFPIFAAHTLPFQLRKILFFSSRVYGFAN
jgi:hypothetical protein